MSTYSTFIGTYTEGDSEGIYRCVMDTDTGECRDVHLAADTADPSFLAVDPTESSLYAVNEVDGGGVTAYDIQDGELSRINNRVIGPADPCHVSVDATGSYIFLAHYTGGAVSILPIESNGGLGEPSIWEHEGASVDPQRQNSPHPHSANPGPNNEHLYVPDLGTDEVVIYAIDHEAGSLDRQEAVSVHDGAGPRHLTFDATAKRAYLINELDSTVTVFEWDEQTGSLEHLDTQSTISEPQEDNFPADIHLHPSCPVVYGSNRGADTIAVFDIEDGLELIDETPTRGEWPRNFAVAPDGTHLFVANEHTDSIVPFAIDQETGKLTSKEQITDVPAPVCLVALSE